MKDKEAATLKAAAQGGPGLAQALRALPGPQQRLVMLAYSGSHSGAASGLSVELPLEAFAESGSGDEKRTTARLEDTCAKLLRRTLVLRSAEGGLTMTNWLASVEIAGAPATVTLRLQPAVKKGLKELRDRPQAVPLEAQLRLKGKYSLGILEMLLAARPRSKGRAAWELETLIEDIRSRFSLDDRYSKAKALRKWVIADALAEINQAELGLRVEVETRLHGKKTRGFLFRVQERKPGPEEKTR